MHVSGPLAKGTRFCDKSNTPRRATTTDPVFLCMPATIGLLGRAAHCELAAADSFLPT
jgi:hypothetical protein